MKNAATSIPAHMVARYKKLEQLTDAARKRADDYEKKCVAKTIAKANIEPGCVLVRERPDYVNAWYRVERITGCAASGKIFYVASTCTKDGLRRGAHSGVRINAADSEYKLQRAAA